MLEKDTYKGQREGPQAEPREALSRADVEVIGVEWDRVGVDHGVDGQASKDGKDNHGDGETQRHCTTV